MLWYCNFYNLKLAILFCSEDHCHIVKWNLNLTNICFFSTSAEMLYSSVGHRLCHVMEKLIMLCLDIYLWPLLFTKYCVGEDIDCLTLVNPSLYPLFSGFSHSDSVSRWHNSEVWNLGHCRSGALPQFGTHVLQRSAGGHRGLRHHKWGTFAHPWLSG